MCVCVCVCGVCLSVCVCVCAQGQAEVKHGVCAAMQCSGDDRACSWDELRAALTERMRNDRRRQYLRRPALPLDGGVYWQA